MSREGVIRMHYISGEDRNQISVLPPSIDEYVTDENPVRVIDAFVDSLDMTAMGFERSSLNSTGRPPYANQDMLKLYIYGYFNRIRSSRCLERETHRNLEVIWLMKNLRPDHKTIARFRHDNPKALNRNVMPLFTKLPAALLEPTRLLTLAVTTRKVRATLPRTNTLRLRPETKTLKTEQ